MRLLIVWHSRTGASQQLAFFAAKGAQHTLNDLGLANQCTVQNLPAEAVRAKDLLQAQAYLFFAPENLGSLSGEMKACFDRHYYELLDQLNGRPYSAMISAGSSGSGAAQQLERICTGWRLRLVQPIQVINLNAQTPQQITAPKTLSNQAVAQAQELGGLLAGHLCL